MYARQWYTSSVLRFMQDVRRLSNYPSECSDWLYRLLEIGIKLWLIKLDRVGLVAQIFLRCTWNFRKGTLCREFFASFEFQEFDDDSTKCEQNCWYKIVYFNYRLHWGFNLEIVVLFRISMNIWYVGWRWKLNIAIYYEFRVCTECKQKVGRKFL